MSYNLNESLTRKSMKIIDYVNVVIRFIYSYNNSIILLLLYLLF